MSRFGNDKPEPTPSRVRDNSKVKLALKGGRKDAS